LPAPAPGPRRHFATVRDTARTRRQRVLELALAGHDPGAIAQTLGVSRRTVERALAAHRELLQELRHQRLQHIADRLAAGAATAIAVLGQVAEDVLAPPAARVRAAAVLLAEVRAFTDVTDLAARLAAVEERLATIPAPSAEAPGAPPEARALPGRPAALDRTQAVPDMLLDQTVNGGS
jgi:AraC-like DNA-binding protein